MDKRTFINVYLPIMLVFWAMFGVRWSFLEIMTYGKPSTWNLLFTFIPCFIYYGVWRKIRQ